MLSTELSAVIGVREVTLRAARFLISLFGLSACLLATSVSARPVAYEGATTLIGEYESESMNEVQGFYSPSPRWSFGAGYLKFRPNDSPPWYELTYVRGNLLLHRWNLPRAQANFFGWGAIGSAERSDAGDGKIAWNAGGQGDYETLRIYASLKTDWHYSDKAFSHRIDTAQLGWAPYTHDWDTLATWFVIRGRHHTGDLADEVETAALVRFFKNGRTSAFWVEAGVTQDGHLLSMFMITY